MTRQLGCCLGQVPDCMAPLARALRPTARRAHPGAWQTEAGWVWGIRVGPMSALWGQEGVAGFAVSPEPYVLEEPVGTGLGDLTGPRETEGSTGRNEAKAPTGSHAAAVGRAVAKACPPLPALRWAAVTRAGFLNLTAAAASGLPVGTGWLRPGEPGDLPSSLRSCSRGTAHPGQRLWGQSCQSCWLRGQPGPMGGPGP